MEETDFKKAKRACQFIMEFRVLHKHSVRMYILDVLWGQRIKLIQVVSTSEFDEY